MKHGANIYKYAKKINSKPKDIIDFSSNINFYNKPLKLTLTNKLITSYADTNYTKLKKTIAKKFSLKRSQVQLYNGASSAIVELIKSLKNKKIYLYAPLYSEYERASKDKQIIKINRFKDFNQKVSKNSTVVFVNPSTPDGHYYALNKLFRMWKKQNCTIIIDESFLEFESLKSMRMYIKDYKKLYIIQSFSKFYSCAGIRIGAVFSHKTNIKRLKVPMWNISSFDANFLNIRLKEKSFLKKSKKLHKTQKKQLYKILKDTNIFDKIYKSDTNFILTKSNKAKQIFKYLLEHKILTRTCKSFDFLDENYLRFGVKDIKKHKILKRILHELS